MLWDKIIQYTSFLICLRVTIDKKLSWDKDVQTAATSFTALKILIWKRNINYLELIQQQFTQNKHSNVSY